VAVDDGALAVSPLIELPHAMFTEQREIVHDLLQLFGTPDFLFFGEIATAGHHGTMLSFSLFIRREIRGEPMSGTSHSRKTLRYSRTTSANACHPAGKVTFV